MDDTLTGPARLLLQLVVILAAARVAGFVARRLGQPQVIAEIVAGMLLGPTLLGRAWPEASALVFPAESLAGLDALSQLGLVLFMYLVGLELDLEEIRRQGRAAASVTIGTVVLPMATGIGLGAAVHAERGPPGVAMPEFAWFMGVALSVTAFPVLARILAERGMLRTRVGTLALTAAAGKDLLGFLFLGLAVATAGATGPSDVLRAAATTLLYVAAMTHIVRPALARIERRFGTMRDLTQTGLALLFLALLMSALLAEYLGIHALFGAFLAGVATPRVRATVQSIRHRVEDLATLVLLPVFFASTGLRTDLAQAWTAGQLPFTIFIVLVAAAAMVVGAVVPARLTGLSWRDGVTLGVLANTRGLMELVILKIGFDLGLLPPDLFATLVVMAIANTLLTAPLVSLLYPRSRVLEETARAQARGAGWKLLACVADPDSAIGLGRLSAALCACKPAGGWALRLVAVDEQTGLFPDPPTESEDPARLLSDAARDAGAALDPVTLQAGDTAGAICAFAKRADAVLLGLHRPLWGGAQLGGPVAKIAQDAPCDVLVFHDLGMGTVRRVLLALGGENDDAARAVAERIAAAPGVELSVLDGTRDTERIDALKAAARGADLVVVGIGPSWDLPLQRFEVREPRLLAELGTSLLAVKAGPTDAT
jgi:Kef-type K+ transport system membrane component KefB/nucleotide-binding universal stress UspA family protein